MDLNSLLIEKRSSIIKKWCDVVLRSYARESQKFLRTQKDRFANPIGRAIFEGIESIYDELLQEADSNKISLLLDNIVRMRAVQEFSPSQAVAFVFGLRKIIREELGNELQQNGVFEEWAAFESRIDGLGLLCFDIYAQCRQKMADIRVKEVKTRSERLLQMAGLAYELPEDYEKPGYGGDLNKGQENNIGSNNKPT
ncbi:MAG TPA: hypothetical protein EYP19_00900 [Desulfobacterales bacterium]|nr:hypothetical protein [Desulfobacterales bacterium]